MPQGISGTLVSSAYAEMLLAPGGAASEFRANREFSPWWRHARSQCGPASSIRTLADVLASPLATLLGYHLSRITPLDDDLWLASLDARVAVVPIVIAGWGASLDRAWRVAVRAGLALQARWCLLFNGTHLRVLDAGRTFARRHIDFDLDALADDDAAWRFLACLASPSNLADDGSACTPPSSLARIVSASDAHGVRVCAALRQGVHDALIHVLGGLSDLGAHRLSSGGPALSSLYEQALVAVYRLLFLCFAEARGLVPTWHPLYRDAYTIESLHAIAETEVPPTGLGEAFQAISRLAHHGCEAGDLHVTAFNGRLFAPHRAPLLHRRALPDARVRDLLLALTTVSRGGTRERVAYRDVGVEELGAVYEGLLDYEPSMEPTPLQRPRRERDSLVLLVRSDVSRRKATGTFYTPRAITEFLVRQALEPLVKDRTADRILSLRIVDPAMGSGAFLVSATQYLAHAYESAIVREGQCHETDVSPADRAGFLRLVAQRCIFGVDLNPMAVHLARLSLWLTTLAAEKPLTFLDHHLLAGDSLIGASPIDVTRRLPGARSRQQREERQLPLFDPAALRTAASTARVVRAAIEMTPDDTTAVVRDKERTLAELAATGTIASWKAVADLWCATWFSPHAMPPGVFRALADYVLTGTSQLTRPAADRQIREMNGIAAARRFFHWPLEFPEVFFDSDGRETPDAGFDAVIGNPPWEMLRSDGGAVRKADTHEGDRPALQRAVLRFTRHSGVYHAQSQGHANHYQLFLERAISLARPGGRISLVLPSGLATDHGSAALRRLLLQHCQVESILGFDNRSGVFPIHRSLRFLLLTAARGGETARLRCRFGLQDPAALEGLSEVDHSSQFFLTPALLERLSGPSLAIPELRSTLDLSILEKATERHPPLGAADGWHARFGRELNATEDRRHFRTGRRGLPVIEGKHLRACAVDVEAATFYVDPAVAGRLLDRTITFGRHRLAFRDVAGATNRTTLIAAIVPAGCVTTHTLFCLRSRLSPDEQLILCALFNSYCANFLVRMRVSTHVTIALMDTIPVPRPQPAALVYGDLLRAARAASANPNDPGSVAEMHAAAAEAYELTAEEFGHVLGTFPLVPEQERRAAFAAFTRRLRVSSRTAR
jgi:hypothetical protein